MKERLERAAIELLQEDNHLGDRSQIIGASEVGRCARFVASQKLNGQDIDAAGAGRMLAGKALENTVVQMVRRVFDGVRATGARQVELRHPTVPLVCHPDGLLPDACLEIKTAGASAFRKYLKEGLPIWYEDQATVQAGLAERPSTLLVLVNRDDISQAEPKNIPFVSERYHELVARAGMLVQHVQAKSLPDGEPHRGACGYCPLRNDCPQRTLRLAEQKAEELPFDVQLEAEALLEEIRALADPRTPEEQDREEEAKKALKTLLAPTGYRTGQLAGARVALVESKGRESLDAKALKAAHPDIYAAFLKTGAPSIRLDISWE